MGIVSLPCEPVGMHNKACTAWQAADVWLLQTLWYG